ncbi:MAG: hypothetical protein ACPGXY_04980 [Alphaproteobacteria bacterium]
MKHDFKLNPMYLLLTIVLATATGAYTIPDLPKPIVPQMDLPRTSDF